MSGRLAWFRRVSIVLAVLGAAGAGADAGDIFYVDQDNTSSVQDGLSWSTAVTTVEAGIEVARRNFGGDVWVAEGVYDEERTGAGTLRMRPGIHLYGGFAGGEGALSQRDPVANLTVIDGSIANDGEPAETVIAGAENTILDGFTIQGGEGISGAGMLNVDVSPQVRQCTFLSNHADSFGGGVLNVGDSRPLFQDCTFEGNTASNGGAMANTGATPQIIDCRFLGNSAEEAAGAIFYTPGSECYIQGSEFRENSAETGGALFVDGITAFIGESYFFDNVSNQFGGAGFINTGDAVIQNCVFARNETERQRGGVFAILEADVAVVNCTFTKNVAPQQGGVFFANLADLRVLNCIIWDNTPNAFFPVSSDVSMRFSLIENVSGGTENIDGNPRFRNPANDDYSLLPFSRAINSGDPVGAPETDILGVSRPQEGGIDMGAYEATEAGTPEEPPLGCVFGGTSGFGFPPAGDGFVGGLFVLGLVALAHRHRSRAQLARALPL